MFSESEIYQEDIDYISTLNIDWSVLRSKNILITGATGLIGTVLVDVLMYKNSKDELGVNVLALTRNVDNANSHFSGYIDNSLFRVIKADISEKVTVPEQVDYIFNLASNTHPVLYSTEPIKTIESIVIGTKNILNLAVQKKTERVINASSVEVYGENRGDVERFTEDYCGYIDCNTLRAGYTEGKRLSESLCQAYISEKEIDVVSARLGRVYGATVLPSDTKATTQFIRSAVEGKDIVLKSEGKQEYSYIYVADAVAALLLLLVDGSNGEAYNIADDEIKTFHETAEILAGVNGKEVLFELPSTDESKGFSVVLRALMDSSKLKALGWRAKYHLEEGLTRTVHILRGIDGKES